MRNKLVDLLAKSDPKEPAEFKVVAEGFASLMSGPADGVSSDAQKTASKKAS